MAQCLQNTTLISDILWPAIHVLSSSNLKITNRHHPHHHKYYEFKGLILAFLSVVLSRGVGGGVVRFPNCHECQLGFQYPQNRIILLCRLPEPSIWPAPIKKWIHWKSPGMESHFFSDSTFIRALVATLQLFDGHRQFCSSAPPVIFTSICHIFPLYLLILAFAFAAQPASAITVKLCGNFVDESWIKIHYHCICINL